MSLWFQGARTTRVICEWRYLALKSWALRPENIDSSCHSGCSLVWTSERWSGAFLLCDQFRQCQIHNAELLVIPYRVLGRGTLRRVTQ